MGVAAPNNSSLTALRVSTNIGSVSVIEPGGTPPGIGHVLHLSCDRHTLTIFLVSSDSSVISTLTCTNTPTPRRTDVFSWNSTHCFWTEQR